MRFINQVEPYLTSRELKAVTKYMHSDGWLTEHKKTHEFEKMVAKFLGVKHAIIVTNGTVGLYLALLACGIGKGDSVIVPDYTMIATPNSVRWAGAEVVLCDIEANSMCLDLSRVRLKRNTRALMYVSINGRSNSLDEIVEFCDKNNLMLIEDACQAFASKWKGKYLGTFGKAGVFSFTPHKIITTGQGGAVVTNDDGIYEKVCKLKDFYRVRPGVDIHTGIGFNFKFTDLQSVVGLEQLKTIGFRVKRKKAIYRQYVSGLSKCNFIDFLPTDLSQTVPWFIDVVLGIQRERVVAHLLNKRVGSRPFYPPIHTQVPYEDSSRHFPISSKLCNRGLWLPSSISLTYEEIDYVTRLMLQLKTG
jgi:perosamine synthetase